MKKTLKAKTKRVVQKKSVKAAPGKKAVPLVAPKSGRPSAVGSKTGTAKSAKPRVAPRESAAKPAGAASAISSAGKPGSVRIFQIYYHDEHQQALDPAFVPYDSGGNPSELQEFAVFENLAQNGKVAGAQYWGALSWRFHEKTGMSGKEWLAAMAARPGFDAYFCNPHPNFEALYQNLWVRGEVALPSFMLVARAFFEAAGLPVERLMALQPASTFASANYFVATPSFWEAYLRFVRRAIDNAERRMPSRIRVLLHSKQADPDGDHFGATYLPFIVERLFAEFLATDGAAFKVSKVPLPAREKEMDGHMRLLREMKDVACKTKSIWMASCWVNYRNVYLGQTRGLEWCNKYLPSMTPVEAKFA